MMCVIGMDNFSYMEHPDGYGCGWWQAAASRSQWEWPAVRGYVRTLKFLPAKEPGFPNRKEEGMANASNSA